MSAERRQESGDVIGARTAESGASRAYDFERLERAVEFLIAEHERLTGEKEGLLEELVDRERRIAALESRLVQEREKREVAVEGVDKILGRLEQLQASVAEAVDPA